MKFKGIKNCFCIQIFFIGLCCISNAAEHHKRKTLTNDPNVLTLRLGPNINLNQTDSVNSNRSKLILVNVENSSVSKIDNVIQRILQTDAAAKMNSTNREKRDVSDDIDNSPQGNYYEEQSPVVIHSEAGPMSISNEADQADSRYDSDSSDYNYGRSANADDYEYANDYGEEIEASDARNTIEATGGGRASPDFESYYRQQQTGTSSTSHRQPQGHEYSQKPYETDLNRPSPMQHRQKPQTTSSSLDTSEESSSFLSIIERIKSIWEMYQAFSSALNQIAERHRQSYQRKTPPAVPESRINSKKPTNFERRRNDNATAANSSPSSSSTSSDPTMDLTGKYNSSADARNTLNNSVERYRRDAVEASTETSIAKDEGRYIKGDPLKGYYDFVITEGSYKFWAAFQVGTAILIIYSTFAAIYYSKVNPLVSDYDYTDYLGGGRSLSGDGDADFIDDDTTGTMPDDDDAVAANRTPKWLNMAGHTVQFILDAIDRIPQEDQLSKKDDGRRSGKHY